MYQFLASLPSWFWAGVLVLAGLIIILLFGSTAAAALIAVIKGGKVEIKKDGVEIDTEEHNEKEEVKND